MFKKLTPISLEDIICSGSIYSLSDEVQPLTLQTASDFL